jgi:hypothetical protein
MRTTTVNDHLKGEVKMFCKWCGETVSSKDLKCKHCGRDIPPLSDCGGFCNLVTKPDTEPTPDNVPINQTTNNKNDISILAIVSSVVAIVAIVLILIINIKVNSYIDIIKDLEERVYAIEECAEETSNIGEDTELPELEETTELAGATKLEETTESVETTQSVETTGSVETTQSVEPTGLVETTELVIER